MLKIIVDVMGTDFGIDPIIKAANIVAKKNDNVQFIFVGHENEIKKSLEKTFLASKSAQFSIVNAQDVINMTDGILSIRRKTDNSMSVAIKNLKKLSANAVISGGATGPFIAACHLFIGEIPGIKRPGFMPFIPTITKDKVVSMIDVGANLENDAQDLVNFASIANIYYQKVMNIATPRIGLLNIGTEASKGKDYQQEAYKQLQANANIKFIGNIEPRDITSDIVDIIVTDGYTGNIALKSIEGMAKNLMSVLKKQVTKNLWRKICALFLKSAFNDVRETFNYKNYACALVLGLNNIAVKTHGNSNVKSWISTFEITLDIIKSNFLQFLKSDLKNEGVKNGTTI